MKPDRTFVVVAAALMGAALGYLLPAYLKLPNLMYHPTERRYFWGHPTGPLPMGYLGQVCYGLVGGILSAMIVWLVVRRSNPQRQTIVLAGAWALTVLALVAAFFTWQNWP